jgi:GNAT superfamily N-acetyltransferase
MGMKGPQDAIEQPQKLLAEHNVSNFDCGEPALNEWLHKRSKHNEQQGASRTYVVCKNQEIVGYYYLAVGAVAHEVVPKAWRRNMPDPIPVMLLGRLAVDLRFQGCGIGNGLLKDALLRTLKASEIAGMRALLVHAISPQAKNFYQARGFIPSPVGELTLMLPLSIAPHQDSV